MNQIEKENYDSELHANLLQVGREIEKGVTHKLPPEFVESIVATLDFFGASEKQLGLVIYDLTQAKYKIWDWLGMCVSGRLGTKRGDPVQTALEKLAKLYVEMKDVGGFAWFLRGHDLQAEEPHRCEYCIESYKSYMAGIRGAMKK